MILLWMGISLLLAASIILFIWSVVRYPTNKKSDLTRDEINKSYYQYRLEELKQDEQQGLITDRGSLIDELQQTLLEDIPAHEANNSPSKVFHSVVLLPGIAILFSVSLMVYFSVGSYSKVEQWLAVVERLPELRRQWAKFGPEGIENHHIAALAVGVRSQLERQPENIDDWILLSRLGIYMGDISTGMSAFSHASRLAPEDTRIQLGYAELLVRSAENDDNIKASEILVKILSKEGNNIQALSLFGYNAFELKDYEQAIRAWQILLSNLPPNDKRIQLIEDSIAMARKQMPSDSK